MQLPVFLHIEATPDPQQQQALQGYLAQVPAILHKHRGVPVATYDVERVLDGKDSAKVFIVVSFPDELHIDNFFADPAYQALIPLRQKGFSHLRFYVTSERI